jgi:predicted RNA binding protein YcfA (HicA-like mRNA interferase family)
VPPKPRRLSGNDVVRILDRFGFERIAQRGSHVKLQRLVDNKKQTLTVPLHRELDTGTVTGIFRQASRFIPEGDLRDHFYSD